MNRIKSFLYTIDSSDRVTYLFGLFQFLIAVSATFYKTHLFGLITPESGWHTIFVTFFWISCAGSIVIISVRMILSFRFGTIKFYLNRTNGYLTDLRTNFRNVSLRAKTLHKIFHFFLIPISTSGKQSASILLKQKLFELGEEVGKDFWGDFLDSLKGKEGEMTIKDKLERWLQYDSSSGMGKFIIKSFDTSPEYRLRLEIINPFIYHKRECEACDFLKGYMIGINEQLFGKKMIVVKEVCATNAGGDSCVFAFAEKPNKPKKSNK